MRLYPSLKPDFHNQKLLSRKSLQVASHFISRVRAGVIIIASLTGSAVIYDGTLKSVHIHVNQVWIDGYRKIDQNIKEMNTQTGNKENILIESGKNMSMF